MCVFVSVSWVWQADSVSGSWIGYQTAVGHISARTHVMTGSWPEQDHSEMWKSSPAALLLYLPLVLLFYALAPHVLHTNTRLHPCHFICQLFFFFIPGRSYSSTFFSTRGRVLRAAACVGPIKPGWVVGRVSGAETTCCSWVLNRSTVT